METWNGIYRGVEKRTSSTNKPYFVHRIKVGEKEETFTSFELPPELEVAQGQQVSIPINRTEEGFTNFDKTREIIIEKVAKPKPFLSEKFLGVEPMGSVESLRECLKVANNLLLEALQEKAKALTPYEYAELTVKLGITLWIKRR